MDESNLNQLNQPSPSTPNLESPKHSFKWAKIFLIIIGVVVIGTAGYILGARQSKPIQTASINTSPTKTFSTPTPTPDPTANWKTYRNYQSKFTFKYPSNADAQSNMRENTIYITTLNKPYFFFSLKAENNLENLTAKQYVNNELKTLRSDKNYPDANALADKRQTTIKNYSIGKINGIYVRGGSDGDSVTDFIEIVTVNKNQIYKFMIHDGNGSVDEHQQQLMDQILSTFKFLE